MKLTQERKTQIDSMSYESLLSRWRFAPIGDPMFQDETGEYWGKRMAEKRAEDPKGAIQASKDLGWTQ